MVLVSAGGIEAAIQMNKFNKENTPNASKLMESLRFSGYPNNTALADLVDNSIDANATKVKVSIDVDVANGWSILIADDGIGMDEAILSQALRLGSNTNRNVESDLGRFGMGLVTASISLARRLEVYTKTEDGNYLTGIMDLDHMMKTNSFTLYRESSSPEEIQFAKKHGVETHGTILVLRNCDRISKKEAREFVDSLRKDFGEIYRYFIGAGKKLSINGEMVNVVDPMWQNGEEVKEYGSASELYSDEQYEVKFEDSGKTDRIRIKVFILPQLDPVLMRKLKIGIKNQGFYVLRNFRQIAKAVDLGLWEKHNDLNRVRVELLFSGNLDSVMGVNYSKHSVELAQTVLDKVQNEIMPQITTLRNRFKKEHIRKESGDISYSEAEKIIAQKSKLLDKAAPVHDQIETGKTKGRTRKPGEQKEPARRGRPSLDGIARFEDHSFGVSGPVFEVEKQGRVTIIQWNIDHPFYQRFLVEYKEDKDLLNAVSFLAYSIGEAKLKYSNEETYEMLENIISTFSTNLRVLLS